jgi:hypothetical protein
VREIICGAILADEFQEGAGFSLALLSLPQNDHLCYHTEKLSYFTASGEGRQIDHWNGETGSIFC